MKKIFIKNHLNKQVKTNNGFALFYVVIMISVVMAIAFGLASITYKQKILSSLAYDSQVAFYATDAGMECALFNNQLIFNGASSINCYDIAPANFGSPIVLNNPLANSVWSLTSPTKDPCFSVQLLIPAPPADPRPSFSVKGYNTCLVNQVRYVERNLRAYF